jgi:hypothetical protein
VREAKAAKEQKERSEKALSTKSYSRSSPRCPLAYSLAAHYSPAEPIEKERQSRIEGRRKRGRKNTRITTSTRCVCYDASEWTNALLRICEWEKNEHMPFNGERRRERKAHLVPTPTTPARTPRLCVTTLHGCVRGGERSVATREGRGSRVRKRTVVCGKGED